MGDHVTLSIKAKTSHNSRAVSSLKTTNIQASLYLMMIEYDTTDITHLFKCGKSEENLHAPA